MFLFLVTSCLEVAVQPCMERISIKKKRSLRSSSECTNGPPRYIASYKGSHPFHVASHRFPQALWGNGVDKLLKPVSWVALQLNRSVSIWNGNVHWLWQLTVSSPPKIRGFLVFKIWIKRGVIKNFSEINWKGVLLERGAFEIVSSAFLQKSMFSLLLEYFFYFFVW